MSYEAICGRRLVVISRDEALATRAAVWELLGRTSGKMKRLPASQLPKAWLRRAERSSRLDRNCLRDFVEAMAFSSDTRWEISGHVRDFIGAAFGAHGKKYQLWRQKWVAQQEQFCLGTTRHRSPQLTCLYVPSLPQHATCRELTKDTRSHVHGQAPSQVQCIRLAACMHKCATNYTRSTRTKNDYFPPSLLVCMHTLTRGIS